eukprot:TRINITY_DN23913_c0_g1_i2.p1 TRINITY_DN23913_c0_g1~~TRINITY_DN23913_c0_g1_i2.p1  ORF type:complete len:118 (-),score=21.02 TRINITY_DN23913_c0_g1_i2:99-452(-)
MPGLADQPTLLALEGVQLVVDQSVTSEPGTWVCSEGQVSWSNPAGHSASFGYEAIMMHSISTDAANFPRPCIYCQIDTEGCFTVQIGEEVNEVQEVRFVPADETQVGAMFDLSLIHI